MLYCAAAAANQKSDLTTPPRPTPNPPSLPVQLSVKTDGSPVDTKPPVSSSAAVEKPMSSERRTSSERPESTKRPASSVATATDQPVAKRPMPSSCERSSGDIVSTSTSKTSITPASVPHKTITPVSIPHKSTTPVSSVPHKRAPSFEAEGRSLLSLVFAYLLITYYCDFSEQRV